MFSPQLPKESTAAFFLFDFRETKLYINNRVQVMNFLYVNSTAKFMGSRERERRKSKHK